MVGNQAPAQPHDLNVAASLALQTPARLNPVKVAVDVELQKNRGVIGRPARGPGLHPIEAERPQIKPIHENLNHTDRIVLVDPVL